MNMRSFILFSTLFFTCILHSFEISVFHQGSYYEGEQAFVSVYIEDGTYLNISRGSGVGDYTLTNVSGNANFLFPSYRPAYNGDLDNAQHHWQNNQYYYLELAGTVRDIGNYYGTLQVCHNVTGECKTASYSFYTHLPNQTGFVPVFQDAAASYDRQMELYTSIRNNRPESFTFSRPYIDYYLTKTSGLQMVVNAWVRPSTNSCIEVLSCGNDRHILRQRFTSDVTLGSRQSTGLFKIGYNEVGSSLDRYNYQALPDKNMGNYPGGIDHSYSYAYLYAQSHGMYNNYHIRASQRNANYNPYVNIFSREGVLYSGDTPPSWSNGTCTVMPVTTSTAFNPSAVRTETLERFCSPNTAPTIRFGASTYDFIFEGEDYVSFPEVVDAEGDEVTLSLVSEPGWLEVGTPSDYLRREDWPHQYGAGNVYIRSVNQTVRQRRSPQPGTYYYTLRATDARGAYTDVTRELRVREGSLNVNATGKKFAVLMGDETWFRKYQLDVATGIVNYSNENITLTDFYYDYYGYKGESATQTQPKYWYSNPGFTPSFTDCGSGKFRLRYQYSGSRTFVGNYSYFDNKAGFVYGTGSILNKQDDWSSFSHVSYRRAYNPRMPLYNGDGTLLWGSAPSWANQCDENSGSSSSSSIVSSSSSVISSSSSVWSSSSSAPSSSSSSIGTSSSSGSGIIVTPRKRLPNLALIFKDASANDDTRMNSLIYIQNKDAESHSLANYTIRFYFNAPIYFNSLKKLKILNMVYDHYSGGSFSKTPSIERCGKRRYALTFKLDESASMAGNGRYPNDDLSGTLHAVHWTKTNKTNYASYPQKNYGLSMASFYRENPQMALFNEAGNLVYGTEQWSCDEYVADIDFEVEVKRNNTWNTSASEIDLKIKNTGDSTLTTPVVVSYYFRHLAGQPVKVRVTHQNQGIILSGEKPRYFGTNKNIRVRHLSAGGDHRIQFEFLSGMAVGSTHEFSLNLKDLCLEDCPESLRSNFYWDESDDWSLQNDDGSLIDGYNYFITERVTVADALGELYYGEAAPSSPAAPAVVAVEEDVNTDLLHSRAQVARARANRTDVNHYLGGQLLSGGDFENLARGWQLNGTGTSVRGGAPEGSRYLQYTGTLSQKIAAPSQKLVRDSGAVLQFYHQGSGSAHVTLGNVTQTVAGTDTWKYDTLYFNKTALGTGELTLKIVSTGSLSLDGVTLIAGTKAAPVTRTVRFTTTQHQEIETRRYDGEDELLLTASTRDAMGRADKQFLPFALPCMSIEECNQDAAKTIHNPGMALNYYTGKNPDYPDAGGFPYTQTLWKQDPAATIEVKGAPGKAFSTIGDDQGVHLNRAWSSGVNLSGVNIFDSTSLNNAVKALNGSASSNGFSQYHAAAALNPTHLWEAYADPDGRMSFTVKDEEGRVIISGALHTNGTLLMRSVNELDSRGNIIKSHSPVSCAYTPIPSNCVSPNTFAYDSESRLIKSVEADAGESRSYYDLAGRLRASQTQRQINEGKASVILYDPQDRVTHTGVWAHNQTESALRSYFKNVSHQNNPTWQNLEPGTITRNIYDRMPMRDTLGVKLYPEGVTQASLKYNRTRLAATITDIGVDVESGALKRHSKAYRYDKYGRAIASYAYNSVIASEALRLSASETLYDLSGKVLKVIKYPYGLSEAGKARRITERYTYDRLGRVEIVYVQSGSSAETILAKYEYYPTGAVRSVELAGNVVLDYTYHISGALQNATAYTKSDGKKLYEERLSYEDCGSATCTPQYNGNISRMAHLLVHGNASSGNERNTQYSYDLLNRLTSVNDSEADDFDELFGYDSQGRITLQRRGANTANLTGGEYVYYANTNRLEKVSAGMSDAVDAERNMLLNENFIYDADGNLIEDKSKSMVITYNHQGLPVSFTRQVGTTGDQIRLLMAYDGSGNRITKRYERKASGENDWSLQLATHYTGIGSEIRESGLENATKVVVSLPQGFGRYNVETINSEGVISGANTVPSFEWVIKSHLGSTMLVYGTASNSVKAAYDYRAFGERVLIAQNTDKVTEEFTGKELDEETGLSNHGARLLDPMLGVWNGVDALRYFSSPYVYMGNGYNTIRFFDLTGLAPGDKFDTPNQAARDWGTFTNPMSKSLNVEFFAFIYRDNEGKYVAANPTMASVDAFTLKDMQQNRTDNPLLQDFEATDMIHTHGAEMDGYSSELFSASENDGLYGDKDLARDIGIPIYLFTPSDILKKFDPATESVTYPE